MFLKKLILTSAVATLICSAAFAKDCGPSGQSIRILASDFPAIHAVAGTAEENCAASASEFTRNHTTEARQIMNAALTPNPAEYTSVIVANSTLTQLMNDGLVRPLNDLVEKYGADTVRLFVLFAAPPEQSLEWSDQGVQGAHRFINRIWKLVNKHIHAGLSEDFDVNHSNKDLKLMRSKIHKTLFKVKDDYLRRHSFNTAIAAVMELSNDIPQEWFDSSSNDIPQEWFDSSASPEMRKVANEAIESILLMLNPITPHLCQHLWWQLYPHESIIDKSWPKIEESLLIDDKLKIAIQVNGKLRSEIEIDTEIEDDSVKSIALNDEKIIKHLDGAEVKKIIYVPGKILNIVI